MGVSLLLCVVPKPQNIYVFGANKKQF